MPAFQRYLTGHQLAGGGQDLYHDLLWPQVLNIVRKLFQALASPPSSLQPLLPAVAGTAATNHKTPKLHRYGLDLLVDGESCWTLFVEGAV